MQTVAHYLIIKSSEELIEATTWINLENVMLNERLTLTEDHIL